MELTMSITRKETVQIKYSGSKIKLIGTTFTVEVPLSMSELIKIYSSGEGSGKATLIVQEVTTAPTAEVVPAAPPTEVKTETVVEVKKEPEPVKVKELPKSTADVEWNRDGQPVFKPKKKKD